MTTYEIIGIIFLSLGLAGGILKMFFDMRKRVTTLETKFDDYITNEEGKYKESVRDETRRETALLLTEKNYKEDNRDLNKKIEDLKELLLNRVVRKLLK